MTSPSFKDTGDRVLCAVEGCDSIVPCDDDYACAAIGCAHILCDEHIAGRICTPCQETHFVCKCANAVNLTEFFSKKYGKCHQCGDKLCSTCSPILLCWECQDTVVICGECEKVYEPPEGHDCVHNHMCPNCLDAKNRVSVRAAKTKAASKTKSAIYDEDHEDSDSESGSEYEDSGSEDDNGKDSDASSDAEEDEVDVDDDED